MPHPMRASNIWQLALVTVMLLCFPAGAFPDSAVVLSDVKYISTEASLTVNIMLSGPAKYAEGKLSNPERLYLDIAQAKLSKGLQKSIAVKDSSAKTIRLAQYRPETARLVLDLVSGDYSHQITATQNPHRITITINKGKSVQKAPAAEDAAGVVKETAVRSKTAKPKAEAVQKPPVESAKSSESRPAEMTTPAVAAATTQPQPRDDMADVQKTLSANKFFYSRIGDMQDTVAAPETPPPSKAQELPAPSFISMDFREYLEKVLNANPTVKMNEQDYKRSMITFLRDLQNYDFKLFLNSTPSFSYKGSSIQGASGLNDESEYGVNAYLYITKNIYDGGKKQILEREHDVFKALSQAELLQKNDAVILTAANYYSNFYYQQQVRDFLSQQFTQYRLFQDQVEKKYQRGVRFTNYDLLTTQADSLRLERGLIDQKAGLIKMETAFRQYGHIYSDQSLRLSPLEIDFIPEIEGLQKHAAVHNSSVHAARLRSELQGYKVKEREAEKGLKIDASAAVGWQAGAGGYTGTNNLLADAYLNFSLPLYDGGVVKSQVMAEKIEQVKQRFALQKVTEDTIKLLNELYVDYKNFESSMQVLKQLIDLDEKRLMVSIERLDKGLDDYRAVRDSWREFIDAKMEYLRQAAISQKILVDLSILSGKKIVN